MNPRLTPDPVRIARIITTAAATAATQPKDILTRKQGKPTAPVFIARRMVMHHLHQSRLSVETIASIFRCQFKTVTAELHRARRGTCRPLHRKIRLAIHHLNPWTPRLSSARSTPSPCATSEKSRPGKIAS